MNAIAADLFGEPVSNEVVFRVSLKGPTFSKGEIEIGKLSRELEALEKIVKKNIAILIATGKLDSSFKDIEILIQIEKGSIIQSLRVVFNKKFLAGAGTMVLLTVPELIAETYSHFLNNKEISKESSYAAELKIIETDAEYKKHLANLICPVNQSEDMFVIEDNHGTINIITQPQKEEIIKNLAPAPVDPLAKNGDYEETLTGVVRKLDLDANAGNYFGFTIDNGPAKVPTRMRGEFNLTDIKDIIDAHLLVNAVVKYKDDDIVHIEIINYSILDTQDSLGV